MKTINQVKAARLDGYLDGIISFNGKLRECSANAFFIDQKLISSDNGNTDFHDILSKFFTSQANLQCLFVEKLSNGLVSLESELSLLFLRNILDQGKYFFKPNEVESRTQYFLDNCMDMINWIVSKENSVQVYKVVGTLNNGPLTCIFYAISLKEKSLVLQFIQNRVV